MRLKAWKRKGELWTLRSPQPRRVTSRRGKEGGGERERERETDRQTDRERERGRERESADSFFSEQTAAKQHSIIKSARTLALSPEQHF